MKTQVLICVAAMLASWAITAGPAAGDPASTVPTCRVVQKLDAGSVRGLPRPLLNAASIALNLYFW